MATIVLVHGIAQEQLGRTGVGRSGAVMESKECQLSGIAVSPGERDAAALAVQRSTIDR